MDMFFILLQETPFPQPNSTDGVGQEEVPVLAKVWSDRMREQTAHLFWTLGDYWRKKKGDTFRAGLRG